MNTADLLLLSRARQYAAGGEGRRRRRAACLSMREVADVCLVDTSTIARWETSERVPSGAAAVRWARLLDALGRA